MCVVHDRALFRVPFDESVVTLCTQTVYRTITIIVPLGPFIRIRITVVISGHHKWLRNHSGKSFMMVFPSHHAYSVDQIQTAWIHGDSNCSARILPSSTGIKLEYAHSWPIGCKQPIISSRFILLNKTFCLRFTFPGETVTIYFSGEHIFVRRQKRMYNIGILKIKKKRQNI